MIKLRRLSIATFYSLLALLGHAPLSRSAVPSVQKIFSPSPPELGSFGQAAAATSSFIVVGAESSAYVLQASTGSVVRKLSGDTGSSAEFGHAVSCSGRLAAVGDVGENNFKGAVWVFDTSTGKKVQKLTANDGVSGDQFGNCVAICDNIVLVGAPGEGGMKGAAYVFDATTGSLLRKLVINQRSSAYQIGLAIALSPPFALVGSGGAPSGPLNVYGFDLSQGNSNAPLTEAFTFQADDGANDDRFGSAIAISGQYAIIGAPNTGAVPGAAYVFDMTTRQQIRKLTQPSNGQFGASVAMNSGLVSVGDTGSGQVYLYSALPECREIHILNADGYVSNFGSPVVLRDNLVIIGASGDRDYPYGPQGAVYVWRNLAGPLPGRLVAETNRFAPYAGNALFSSFQSFQSNTLLDSMLLATLSGPAASNGKNRGIWTEINSSSSNPNPNPYPGLLLQTKATLLDPAGDNMMSAISKVAFDHQLAISGNIIGTGISLLNHTAIVGSNLELLAQKRMPLPGLGSPLAASFQQVTTKADMSGIALTFQKGVAGIDSTNDSGTLYRRNFSNYLAQENDSSIINEVNLGQLAPRTSSSATFGIYASFLTGNAASSTDNSALFLMDLGSGSRADSLIARKGESAPGLASTTKYSAFVGECAQSQVLFRTTLSGEPVSSNEALFLTQFPSTPALLIQKGKQLSLLPADIKVASFQRYWITESGGYFVLATLAGPGVNSSNDGILLRFCASPPFTPQILMREGDTAPDCNGAKIGVIQQVDVNSADSCYAIIASLTGPGSDASNNLALWKGQGSLNGSQDDLYDARPFLRLRKGIYVTPGSLTPLKISSMRMTPPQDASGAGNRGLGTCVGSSEAAVLIKYSDGREAAVKL